MKFYKQQWFEIKYPWNIVFQGNNRYWLFTNTACLVLPSILNYILSNIHTVIYLIFRTTLGARICYYTHL